MLNLCPARSIFLENLHLIRKKEKENLHLVLEDCIRVFDHDLFPCKLPFPFCSRAVICAINKELKTEGLTHRPPLPFSSIHGEHL
jgi:hypothetical protein